MLRTALFIAACAAFPACASDDATTARAVAIGSVQGNSDASPRIGDVVVIEGTITHRFGGGGGWYVQDGGDGDPSTSDAVFVDTRDRTAAPRDRVRIRGTVLERGVGGRGTLTTIEPLQIDVLGRGAALPPTVIAAAPARNGDWERHESMLLRVAAPLTVTGTQSARWEVSFDGRPYAPTEIATPGEAAERVAADQVRRRLTLVDGSIGDAERSGYLPPNSDAPRIGSTITRATGVLDPSDGYSLQLTEPATVRASPRPPAPKVGGDVRIASLNLENLFNGDGRGGGFPTPRGAETPRQLALQQSKLVATLRALDPDIAALMELENDGYDPQSSLAQLVAALNAGGGDWRWVDTGHGPGRDEIRVGLIYRSTRIAPVGRPATLEDGPFQIRSRAPLAQAFRAGDGPAFVVAANHFKSKGCREASGADADRRDGQSCWNATRIESARRLHAWLAGDPTGSGSGMSLIVGDLNAYAEEDPLRALRALGWIDAFAAAGTERPYSYVYNGRSGRLDHALLSPALATRLRGAAEWHSNADEPQNVGYQAGNSGENAVTPWRSSDHDPMLIGLALRR